MAGKLKILFLCTGNSGHSQMAEGYTRALKADLLETYSAGIEILTAQRTLIVHLPLARF